MLCRLCRVESDPVTDQLTRSSRQLQVRLYFICWVGSIPAAVAVLTYFMHFARDVIGTILLPRYNVRMEFPPATNKLALIHKVFQHPYVYKYIEARLFLMLILLYCKCDVNIPQLWLLGRYWVLNIML